MGTFVQKSWIFTKQSCSLVQRDIIFVQRFELISIIKSTRKEQLHHLFNEQEANDN